MKKGIFLFIVHIKNSKYRNDENIMKFTVLFIKKKVLQEVWAFILNIAFLKFQQYFNHVRFSKYKIIRLDYSLYKLYLKGDT